MRQQKLEFRTWGGKRKGAGRPPQGKRSSERHKRRAGLDRNHPVHVTLRTLPVVGRLRRRHGYRAVRRAMIGALRRTDFRICQVSIQGNHIHLLVEADQAAALARGMQGFAISCARHLNIELTKRTGKRQTGQVFADRYHPEVLTNPRMVHHALGYILNNWRKHGEDRRGGRQLVDPFSSGIGFDGWDRPVDRRIHPDDELLPIVFPHTYLLSVAWRKHGRISPLAVPGAGRP